ncbi:TPA: fimbrial protein [Escherichia coli]
MKKNTLGIMLFTVLFMPTAVQAIDNLKFRGNLVIPNCTINNGNPIETDFRNIEIQTITVVNTGYHWKLLHIPINCPYVMGTPKIKITGTQGAAVNSIQTNKYPDEKLVIYLKQSTSTGSKGNDIKLGQYQILNSNAVNNTKDNIYITAGIGREGNLSLLTPGPFIAAATLEVRYE